MCGVESIFQHLIFNGLDAVGHSLVYSERVRNSRPRTERCVHNLGTGFTVYMVSTTQFVIELLELIHGADEEVPNTFKNLHCNRVLEGIL